MWHDRNKKKKTGDNEEAVEVEYYTSEVDIENALRIILESCRAIEKRLKRVDRERFMSDEDMQKASAMDMVVLGNAMKCMPPRIKGDNKTMNEAYPFRCVVAHEFGTAVFDMEVLWNGVKDEAPIIHTICAARLKELLEKKDTVASKNVKSIRMVLPCGECQLVR